MGFNSAFKGLKTGNKTMNLLNTTTDIQTIMNVKAIPIQAWIGPEGRRRLKLPGYKKIGTRMW